MKNFAGITGHFSWKRFFFVIVSFIAVLGPIALLCLGMITGTQILDYYKIQFAIFAATYAGGKYIDGKNNPPGAVQ